MSLGACFCFGDFGFRVGELGFSILSNFAKRSLALPVSLVSGASYLASLMVNVSWPALPVGALRARAAQKTNCHRGHFQRTPADERLRIQGRFWAFFCARKFITLNGPRFPPSLRARTIGPPQSGTTYSQLLLWGGRVSR